MLKTVQNRGKIAMKVFSSVPRIISGSGASDALGDEVKRMGCQRALIVCDHEIEAMGIVMPLMDSLKKAGVEQAVFSGVQSDPSLKLLDDAREITQTFHADMVIGMGGGSSLDAAKIIAVSLTNDGPAKNFYGIDNIPRPGLPMILIPTTAGTGSEVTNISVMEDPEAGLKKAIISDHLYAKTALLDPVLTVGLPPHLTAMTGMDALVHAIESFVGVRASLFSDTLNLKAINLIAANLRQAYANGQNIEAREAMLSASCLAGMAFCNTQNGLDHAMALAVGSKYHLPHGLATAFILPWVMEFNAIADPQKFSAIAGAFGEDVQNHPPHEAALLSVKAIKDLLHDLNISYRLSDYGAKESHFKEIAKAALSAGQLIGNNPRQVNEEDVVKILKASL
jgi:alcohol dehydrogenase class IV